MKPSLTLSVFLGVWALVNCAETYAVAEVDWFATEDFNEIMQVNFLGAVRVTKALLPLLRQAKGRVVNVSSLAGKKCSKITLV